MKNVIIVLLGVILLVSIGAGEPGQQATPRLITVTGQSEVNVVPDEVVITLGVETLDKKLSAAKTQNDASVKKILALAPQYQIEAKYVQTSQISIYPRYQGGSWGGSNFIGYEVEKTIVFILKDVSKFEEFLSGVLEAGANSVQGIQFRTTELRKYKDQARAMAVKAAKEKAVAKAQIELEKTKNLYGFKKSKLISINDYPVYPMPIYRGVDDLKVSSTPANEASIQVGEGELEVQVSLVYELR